MPQVNSSAIIRVAYDDHARRLEVTFVTGRVYAYDAVPRRVYERLLRAPSKGQFFNSEIRDRYGATLLRSRSAR
jgi:hypothetical protein